MKNYEKLWGSLKEFVLNQRAQLGARLLLINEDITNKQERHDLALRCLVMYEILDQIKAIEAEQEAE